MVLHNSGFQFEPFEIKGLKGIETDEKLRYSGKYSYWKIKNVSTGGKVEIGESAPIRGFRANPGVFEGSRINS
jgi:hypothetical protein